MQVKSLFVKLSVSSCKFKTDKQPLKANTSFFVLLARDPPRVCIARQEKKAGHLKLMVYMLMHLLLQKMSIEVIFLPEREFWKRLIGLFHFAWKRAAAPPRRSAPTHRGVTVPTSPKRVRCEAVVRGGKVR